MQNLFNYSRLHISALSVQQNPYCKYNNKFGKIHRLFKKKYKKNKINEIKCEIFEEEKNRYIYKIKINQNKSKS